MDHCFLFDCTVPSTADCIVAECSEPELVGNIEAGSETIDVVGRVGAGMFDCIGTNFGCCTEEFVVHSEVVFVGRVGAGMFDCIGTNFGCCTEEFVVHSEAVFVGCVVERFVGCVVERFVGSFDCVGAGLFDSIEDLVEHTCREEFDGCLVLCFVDLVQSHERKIDLESVPPMKCGHVLESHFELALESPF
jgi:hypothetical protein